MNSRDAWWAFGNGAQEFLGWFYDNVGNIANYSFLILGFIGLFYWLNWQNKFNDKAAKTPGQIK